MYRPPKKVGYSWIALQKRWAIHVPPPKKGGYSWITLENWWLFMDRPPENDGGSWIALEKNGSHSTSGDKWIAS